ncbi:MAG: ABC transporter ATP-binding protein [Rectinemataceae bacterium]
MIRLAAQAPLLAAKGLAIGWKARVERMLASGIDLELKAGDFAALVGPNGSGKSTLLRTLVGLQAPLRGEASLCGGDVRRLTIEERSRRAACVFTDRYDSGYFTVFDIVAFGRYPYTGARNRLGPRDLAAVNEAIAAVGLGPLANHRFTKLSDGERQKALVARAIAQDCPVLVLDEPTAFLDAPARVEVFHIARALARSSGKAIVLSTHDIDHALRYADRLWLMDREHRFTAGAPEDLATSGAIGRAFDGEGFRFDPGSGAFRSVETGMPYSIELEGPEGTSRSWTGRLAERLGLIVSSATRELETIASISIEEGENGPLFTIHATGSRDIVAASYGELARFLAELLAERAGDGGS